ncbi:protein BIG GRAIN 1-like [Hordeum vulgare subsp. vulgare]|uniref:Protein BIG GRAIN 1 n=1 Tax=Hordeum vulgare subsp. vulgare TaxID=112509 RepID=A0A8I6XHU6_HORVV|nr:protein BIG GRAIN 1-like [Hordeum vulgare subsp. vulgare]
MERRGMEKGTSAGARRHADQPSFSSSLLDAIYRSMEDEPGHAGGEAAVTKKQQQQKKHVEEALHYSYYYRPSLAGSYRAPGPHATTSSSSECSSYGGFSSSEAESSNHRRLRPIRTVVPGGQPAPAPEKKAKKPAAAGASIRAKLRDLRKPASPGARLAGFLNTIFAGKRSAPQTPPSARAAAAAAAEYACSSASSYSRSCLSKTPSTRGHANRTVRFADGDREAPATVPGADRRRVPALAVEQMLLRRMEMESDEDEDDDEDSSDASSDLFELENFAAAVAVPPGAGYRDELPVYETTRVVLSRGIGHAYGHGRSARVV